MHAGYPAELTLAPSLLPSMVIPPFTLLTSTWNILLSESMVVLGFSFLASDVHHLYLRRIGIL